jgi:hypothetical protein
VAILRRALARDRLGEFQAQAAIAALHADAPRAEDTDWVQIVEWYDELVRLTDSPIARLNRAVADGEARGPRAGLAALAELDPALPRHSAAAAYLHERDGEDQRGDARRVSARVRRYGSGAQAATARRASSSGGISRGVSVRAAARTIPSRSTTNVARPASPHGGPM